MSRALGTFEQNWTLDCVCDECNQFFADNLELPLGRDSREAFFRFDLGLKPADEASDLLHRRVKARVRDPGQFDGVRIVLSPSHDGSEVVPVPVPQIGFRRPGEEWHFFTERELTPDSVRDYQDSALESEFMGLGLSAIA